MEIPESDLYRIFTIGRGGYKGDYKLYFNRTVAELFLTTSAKIYKWREQNAINAEPGDYIESMDGSVLMLLRKRKYIGKKTNVVNYFFRFPMCTIGVYQLKTGEYKFREFYGQMTYLNKNRLVSIVKYGTDNQKVRFVSYIVSGAHPFWAYRTAFSRFEPLEIATLHRRVNSLMDDKVVKAEIRSQLMPLMEKLEGKFSDDRLVSELEMLLNNSRKGSDAHRENIKFIMALLNKLPDEMTGTKKGKALDTPFEVVPPFELEKKEEKKD